MAAIATRHVFADNVAHGRVRGRQRPRRYFVILGRNVEHRKFHEHRKFDKHRKFGELGGFWQLCDFTGFHEFSGVGQFGHFAGFGRPTKTVDAHAEA